MASGRAVQRGGLAVLLTLHWFKDATPDDPLIRDRVARCLGRPLIAKVRALDQAGVVQDVAA